MYRHARIHTCIHACMHVYFHTSVHTQMHACIHRYIHTQFAHAGRQTHECVCVHAFRSQHRASKARAAAQREGPRCMHACVSRGHSGHASARGRRGRMYACIHTQGRARSACVRNFPALRESLRRVCGACEAHTGGGEKHCHDQCHLSPAPPHRRVHHHLWQCPAPRPHRPASLALCSVRG